MAPHNIIDSQGLAALAEAFPSIRVICALYVGKEGETEQEFGWSSNNRFYNIPRLTSGYIMDNYNRFILYDAIHNFGIVSHFIHPDDVFDKHRSTNFSGWGYMKKRFAGDFGNVKENFPWIRWMTVKDSFQEFVFYNSTNLRVKKSGRVITVYSSDGSNKYIYFRMRIGKKQKIKKLVNCKQVNRYKNSGDVILKTNSHIAKIILR